MPANAIRQEMARLRKEVAIIGLIVGAVAIIAILIVGWLGDHRSCQRSNPLRAAQIETREINRDSIQFWRDRGEPEIAARAAKRVKADSGIRVLDCSQILPGA